MRYISIFLTLLLAGHSCLLAEVQITARFNPPRIALGDQAQYIVEITETDNSKQPEVEKIASLPIPQSEELKFRNGRTTSSRQTSIINGATEYRVTQNLIIDALPASTGKFVIPAFIFEYKGERFQVPAASLEVVERSADAGPTRAELIFLRAELPKKLYVGQHIPVELKLYIEESAQLRGLNSFDRSADGFTISELPEDYREAVEMENGRRYRTLTWPLTLTAIQTGDQELSFQFGLTVRLPGQDNRRDSFGRSPFGGSLFDDFFSRPERINVYSEAASIEVLPLPEAGKPKSFSGAIGDFAMEVGADSDQATQGEPIMLTVEIKGRGNFERITGPDFPETAAWKHYDPEINFEASDASGLSGSQRFDYVFIPQESGKLKLPETRFSYFDPQQEEYIELTAPPIPVDVSPAKSSPVTAPVLPKPSGQENELQLSKSLSGEEALLTLDYRPKPSRPVGRDILRSPLFIVGNILAGCLLAATAFLLHRRKKNCNDPGYALRVSSKQSLRAATAAYKAALSSGEADVFFKEGQIAIRHAATLRTGRPMQSAECSQIEALLPTEAAGDCRAFFEIADAHRFGGSTEKELNEAAQKLERVLTAL